MATRFIQRLFPHPLLSVALVIIWQLLANQPSINSLVFGIILGVLLPFATAAYWPNRPQVTRPWKLIPYGLLVAWDIITANVTVAMIVLFKPNRNIHSAWVNIPLDIRTPEAITALAGTITLTPGTVSVDLSDEGHALLVHALHADDPEAVARKIKHRYERRLKEIFE
ncbi:Na+/H+ antiporter subunit E [Alloyangia pacifica]|uniref:Multisubunit potassium/proton antiporter, PhaE subunit (TC 2.A.63.1.1) n=1 Tax=Alloyangia pacifica TaxID=311180 RepID=A0A1I6QVC6_9RHOB|nr:Na+/H+ antiporter subunit E [Alloyangia pacifica]SDG00712.1 multisubunit potassium/proton antiporter, PhaE subunit [Alloyangia pacifica]SFS56395.1 multisubunit potassium/proton antiporter, PhaE subunit (TC 2.A.63.1.1) [Alloyangia pacifica]